MPITTDYAARKSVTERGDNRFNQQFLKKSLIKGAAIDYAARKSVTERGDNRFNQRFLNYTTAVSTCQTAGKNFVNNTVIAYYALLPLSKNHKAPKPPP